MHLPRYQLWQEMLATPQLVRFEFPCTNGDERHPTLIIKASSLLLKYIVQGAALKISFFRTSDNRCAYALHIDDDPKCGVALWSMLASEDEVLSIKKLAELGSCSIYLFNEACTNCAWTSATVAISLEVLQLVDLPPPANRNTAAYTNEIHYLLDIAQFGPPSARTRINVSLSAAWKPLQMDIILNGGGYASLNLLADNEGAHQEQLANALLGELSPAGAYINARLYDAAGDKEFTDIVLTHPTGAILVESKSLSIFGEGKRIPTRDKLARTIQKAAKKGLNQLQGAIGSLRDGLEVFDGKAQPIRLERVNSPQAILLVPDLSLFDANNDDWLLRVRAFTEKNKCQVHILDTVQLFRLAQGARMLSEQTHAAAMPVFNHLLQRRFDKVLQSGLINIDTLIR